MLCARREYEWSFKFSYTFLFFCVTLEIQLSVGLSTVHNFTSSSSDHSCNDGLPRTRYAERTENSPQSLEYRLQGMASNGGVTPSGRCSILDLIYCIAWCMVLKRVRELLNYFLALLGSSFFEGVKTLP